MRKLLVLFVLCNIHLGYSQSTENIFLKAEAKINSLNCFSYKSIHSSSVAGDTALFYRYTYYQDIVSNTDDAVFGSSFKSCFKDSAKIDLDYHGNLAIRYNWDKKTMRIDTINPKSESVSLNA